jgi:hypothetical protein
MWLVHSHRVRLDISLDPRAIAGTTSSSINYRMGSRVMALTLAACFSGTTSRETPATHLALPASTDRVNSQYAAAVTALSRKNSGIVRISQLTRAMVLHRRRPHLPHRRPHPHRRRPHPHRRRPHLPHRRPHLPHRRPHLPRRRPHLPRRRPHPHRHQRRLPQTRPTPRPSARVKPTGRMPMYRAIAQSTLCVM